MLRNTPEDRNSLDANGKVFTVDNEVQIDDSHHNLSASWRAALLEMPWHWWRSRLVRKVLPPARVKPTRFRGRPFQAAAHRVARRGPQQTQ